MFKKRRSPIGSKPGTLLAHAEALAPRVSMIRYSAELIEERQLEHSDLSSLTSDIRDDNVTWIDVQGLSDVDLIQKLGEMFELHPLALEDVVNIPQRPKAEDYDSTIYLVTYMISAARISSIAIEQISIFVGKNFVITFQEKYGDVFEPVRQRIRRNKGVICKYGSDYLAYALVDAVIDAYYPVLERLGEYIEHLENALIENPQSHFLEEIYKIRRQLLALRRAIFPQREVLSSLIRDENAIFKESTTPYLRDCYDHSAQLIDVLETYREISTALIDIYLSGISNRTNEVMKVLTIISTIFIPLSFLAGVYGMNFDYMPELKVEVAYPIFWIVVATIAGGMLYFFKRIGWLNLSGNPSTKKGILQESLVIPLDLDK